MNIVCFGAHPDDAEVYAGGTLVKWAQAGHSVLLVSLTNGDSGHHAMERDDLAQCRKEEAAESARRGGVRDLVLDFHDGELFPTLELRNEIIRIIREEKADIVLTHRPWDYHPDHRYGAMAVQDAAYMVMVPHACPGVTALRTNPVFFYMMDHFQKPTPFQADIAVDVTDVMPTKLAMLDAMPSQFYEWLPWIEGHLDAVPQDAEARKAWLGVQWDRLFQDWSNVYRDGLIRWYGDAATDIRYVEAFELCEYGRQPDAEEMKELFPFLPQ